MKGKSVNLSQLDSWQLRPYHLMTFHYTFKGW